jgi:hypothetical protein
MVCLSNYVHVRKDHYITDLRKYLCRRPLNIYEAILNILDLPYVQSILYGLYKHLHTILFNIRDIILDFFGLFEICPIHMNLVYKTILCFIYIIPIWTYDYMSKPYSKFT